jgi:hypothetical protein
VILRNNQKHIVANKNPIGFWSIMAIGVSGMAGDGIFAVLGLAV